MDKVKVWEEKVMIPTYEAGKPDKNPIFLEKRVYQGSSGKIYPHSVIDKISDVKRDKEYTALYLENDYIKVMMLPELGGRIQRAYDKTNDYDFIYYNHVIKPALVGLAGPWISGGIEFNWPQHHRPSTFDPVEYSIRENEDGSATVTMGEIENMFRTEGVLSVTLYPDKAYIELSAKLYNRTNVPQTFLWWANPAVSVNDDTVSVFPEDVNAVYDHGKRDVISFPLANGTYYKHKYENVDIARYKNIPVPTSYMAYKSDYNFIGEYDFGKNAGLIHVADHHVAPGKKQWTWGNGEFGKAWDRALTDEDGPYIELMCGCFTDNQPDFTWMLPMETKNFKQYFMPYKNMGYIKNATVDGAINLAVNKAKRQVEVLAYATAEHKKASIRLYFEGNLKFSENIDISPSNTYERVFTFEELGLTGEGFGLKAELVSEKGKVLVDYTYNKLKDSPIPEPAKAAPLPSECETNEDLFLYGRHIEQYRHATYNPEDYYLEGLKRDSGDIRLNNAYGLCLLRKCNFLEAEKHFRKAILRATRSNPNPYDMEPYYNLGLALKYQGKYDEAYDAFYKSVWGGNYQAPGFYQLACIDVIRGDLQLAYEHANESLMRQYHNMKTRSLLYQILLRLGKPAKAINLKLESIEIDPLFDRTSDKINHNTALELICDYYEAGLYSDGIAFALDYVNEQGSCNIYPMIYYYTAYGYHLIGNSEKCAEYIALAEKADSFGCFPHRVEDAVVLERITKLASAAPMANYYLGCLFYDKKEHDKAISYFERAREGRPDFATVHRNLCLAYYNIKKNPKAALEEIETALSLDKTDSRVFMEYDQLLKKLNTPLKDRLAKMNEYMDLVEDRDDMYLEYINVLISLGELDKALSCLKGRKFHQWEGGEGKSSGAYIFTLTELAKRSIKASDYEAAAALLEEAAKEYPENLGEGKLEGAKENNVYYFLGECYHKLGDNRAEESFKKACEGISEPAGMMYYNDQPPEMIFYQALSFRALGVENEALARFNKLYDYGTEHMEDEVKIEYFAVSLPDLLTFEEDLNLRNRKHCLFMKALGAYGLGRTNEAESLCSELHQMDFAHQGIMHLENI